MRITEGETLLVFNALAVRTPCGHHVSECVLPLLTICLLTHTRTQPDSLVAIQLAKHRGVHVIATCSNSRQKDLLASMLPAIGMCLADSLARPRSLSLAFRPNRRHELRGPCRFGAASHQRPGSRLHSRGRVLVHLVHEARHDPLPRSIRYLGHKLRAAARSSRFRVAQAQVCHHLLHVVANVGSFVSTTRTIHAYVPRRARSIRLVEICLDSMPPACVCACRAQIFYIRYSTRSPAVRFNR